MSDPEKKKNSVKCETFYDDERESLIELKLLTLEKEKEPFLFKQAVYLDDKIYLNSFNKQWSDQDEIKKSIY